MRKEDVIRIIEVRIEKLRERVLEYDKDGRNTDVFIAKIEAYTDSLSIIYGD